MRAAIELDGKTFIVGWTNGDACERCAASAHKNSGEACSKHWFSDICDELDALGRSLKEGNAYLEEVVE